MKNFIVSILGSLLFFTQLSAQVSVTVLVDPNPSPYIDDLKSNPNGLRATISNLSGTTQTINLIGTMKLDDKVVNEAKYGDAGVSNITLTPGQVVTKRAIDVLNFNEFDFGDFRNTVVQTGQLPAGNYSICVTAVDAATGASVSSEACGYFKVTDYYPAELLMPLENALLTEQINQFTWTSVTPVYTASALTYTLKIWELNPGENPIAVVKYDNNVVVNKPNISTVNSFINFQQEFLQTDKEYIWTVQAYEANGRKVGTQSIPRKFKYGQEYSNELKVKIKLLGFHENLVKIYLDLKKITECAAAEELKTKVGEDSLKRQTNEDKLANEKLLTKFTKKKLDDAQRVYSTKILDVTTKMDLLLIEQSSLSAYQSDVNKMKTLKDEVFSNYANISQGLKPKVFGEKLKNDINKTKPGAYSFTLVKDDSNCEVLMGVKPTKLTKEEKNNQKELNYLLALANACDETSIVLKQASASVNNGGKKNKAYNKVADSGKALYERYDDVKKHVSVERRNETKNQQGFERLQLVFDEISAIRNDKERLTDTKAAEKNSTDAGILFRGGVVNTVAQVTNQSDGKVAPIDCFFSNMETSSNGTANGLETAFSWDQKMGADTVKVFWKEASGPAVASEKLVVSGASSVSINLKSNVEYEVTLIAYAQGQEVAKISSKGTAKLSSANFLLGCNPKVKNTSNVKEEEELSREELCNFFSSAKVNVKEATYSSNSVYNYGGYSYKYNSHREKDPFEPKKYSASVVVENKAKTINYLFYPADDASQKKNGSKSSLSKSDSVVIEVASGNIEVNKDYVVVIDGVTDGKTIGEVFIKFYVDQDEKVHFLSGCSLDQVTGRSFEKEEMRVLSDCFFNQMYAYHPDDDDDYCFMFCIGTELSFRWHEYGEADEIKIENKCTMKSFGKIERTHTYKRTLKPGDEYYSFKAYAGSHEITFMAFKDGKEIDRKFIRGKVAASSFKITDCEDNVTAPEPVKFIDCPFSNVESTVGRSYYNDFYTAKFKWKKNKNVVGVKAIWHPVNDQSKKMEQTFGSGGGYGGIITQANITLEKGVEYVLALQAFNGYGDFVGGTFGKGRVNESTSTFQIGCNPVPSPVIELDPVEEQCYFTKVSAANTINGADSSYNHTINWESKDVAMVQVKCISQNTEAKRTVVKHFNKDVKTYTHGLSKDEYCLCAITAFAGNKALGHYYSGSFKKEDSNVDYNCFGNPSAILKEGQGENKEIFPVKEEPKEEEPVVKKSDCFFGDDITLTQTISGDMIFSTFKWTEQQDSTAKLKIKWNEAKNPNNKDEQKITKGKKSATIALKKGINYTVSLIAEKGGYVIARAIGAGNVNGSSSTINLSCKAVVADEIDNCFFENLYSTQSASGNKVNKTFNWTQKGWATKVIIKWHEAKNKNAKGEQVVQAGQSSTTITLDKDVDYKVTLLAYMNNDVVGKAMATGKVNNKKSTINLACKRVAVPEVEGCFFRYMEVKTVKKNDSVYSHTFKWEPQGEVDKYELAAHNKSTNKLEKIEIENGMHTGTIELKKGTEYWVGLMAYRGEKIFARSDNFSIDGGSNNMTLPCNPFSKNTATTPEVKNCMLSDFSSTRSAKDDANGYYDHTLSWKVNGDPRGVVVVRHNLSHNRIDSVNATNGNTVKYKLQKANKYKFTLKAKNNALKTIATATSYVALGKDKINLVCADGSVNSAELRYEDKCITYDYKTVKKTAKPDNKTENVIQFTLKPGHDSYKFYLRNESVASEVYYGENVIRGVEKHSGKNYRYDNTFTLKNDQKYIAEVYVYKGGEIVASAKSKATLGNADFVLVCDEAPATKINPANTPPASGYEGMDEKCNAFDIKTTNSRIYYDGHAVCSNEISFKLKPGIADSYKMIIKSVAGHEISEHADVPYKLTDQEKSYPGAIVIKDITMGLNPTVDYIAYLFVYKDGKVTASAKSEATKGEATFVLTCQDGLKEPEIPKNLQRK